MASSSPLLLAAVVIALLFSLASARPGLPFHPCNTLLISYSVSTTSSSSYSRPTTLEIASISSSDEYQGNSPRFLTIYRVLRPRHIFVRRPEFTTTTTGVSAAQTIPSRLGISSLQDRARDILVVVGGLLFGVGCGALTAATMYLAWSLIAHRHEMCGGSDEFDEEDEDLENAKQTGYVLISGPTPDSVHVAKEGYEGKN